ncbi:MAG: hypothetical protein ACAF41_34500 (plasmid) [Leptolyngbya sp. BL-A-14]
MNHLQDFLTLIATAIEYFFFAYLAVALMIHSLKPLDAVMGCSKQSSPLRQQFLSPTGSDRLPQGRHLRVWLVSTEPKASGCQRV